MKKEFWAEFDVFHEAQKRALIHYFVGKENTHTSWKTIEDYAARQSILAQLLASDEECARRTKCKDYAKGKNGLQWWYYGEIISKKPQGSFQQFLKERLEWMASLLNLVKPPKSTAESPVSPRLPDLAAFPPGSWAIQLTFTLRKPYISKDDTDFYILDNPVKKEWAFKVPYVAPSQWKGALRAAMVRDLVNKLQPESEDKKQVVDETQFVNERLRLYRLFGNEKDGVADFLNRAWTLHRVGPRPEDEDQAQEWEQRFQETVRQVASEFENRLREEGYRVGDVEGFQGRLHFYPTFFDKIGLEVINPHERETGAGKNPIYFEAVPAGTKGVFTLLYVPLGAGPTDEATCVRDLAAVARGVQAMLTVYGFGAKTSSGYGVVEKHLEDGKLVLHAPDTQPSSPMEATEIVEPEESFYKYLGDLGEVKPEFKGQGEGGLMSNSEYKRKGALLGGGSLGEFKRFRTWYLAHGEAWRESLHSSYAKQPETLSMIRRTFSSLEELVALVDGLLQVSLNNGMGGENA